MKPVTRSPITLLAIALPFALAMSQAAFAYDPCQRALEDREIARDALNQYYATHCSGSYELRHCRNPQRGRELEHRMQVASARTREQCH